MVGVVRWNRNRNLKDTEGSLHLLLPNHICHLFDWKRNIYLSKKTATASWRLISSFHFLFRFRSTWRRTGSFTGTLPAEMCCWWGTTSMSRFPILGSAGISIRGMFTIRSQMGNCQSSGWQSRASSLMFSLQNPTCKFILLLS